MLVDILNNFLACFKGKRLKFRFDSGLISCGIIQYINGKAITKGIVDSAITIINKKGKQELLNASHIHEIKEDKL